MMSKCQPRARVKKLNLDLFQERKNQGVKTMDTFPGKYNAELT